MFVLWVVSVWYLPYFLLQLWIWSFLQLSVTHYIVIRYVIIPYFLYTYVTCFWLVQCFCLFYLAILLLFMYSVAKSNRVFSLCFCFVHLLPDFLSCAHERKTYLAQPTFFCSKLGLSSFPTYGCLFFNTCMAKHNPLYCVLYFVCVLCTSFLTKGERN